MNKNEKNEIEKRYRQANLQLIIIVIVVIIALILFISHLENVKIEAK